jgi:hypothetical protein
MTTRYTILPGFEAKPTQAAYSLADREFCALADGRPVAWFGPRGCQDAEAYANEANYRDALEARAEERDAAADLAALHPRYVARGGDVVDTGAGRFYCTLTAWPYSPAARDGAVLGRAA